MTKADDIARVLEKIELKRLFGFDLTQDNLCHLDFAQDPFLSQVDISQEEIVTPYIFGYMNAKGAHVAYGGYNEQRDVYENFPLFSGRTIHLGTDFWLKAGNTVKAPIDGVVHSVANYNTPGNYGGVVILKHHVENVEFYSLYGHLDYALTLVNVREGFHVKAGKPIGIIGDDGENGGWTPHLHLQLIGDLEGNVNDYPGLCDEASRSHYLANCPDPMLLVKVHK